MRRTWTTGALAALLSAALVVPASASHDDTASQVPSPTLTVTDPRGDVTYEDGSTPTGNVGERTPAYDITQLAAGAVDGDLVVELELVATVPPTLDSYGGLVLADARRSSQQQVFWIFAAPNGADEPPVALLIDDRTEEVVELDCDWSATFPERHVVFTIDPEGCQLGRAAELWLGAFVGEDTPEGRSLIDSVPASEGDDPPLAGPLGADLGVGPPVPTPRDIEDTCPADQPDAFTDDDGSPFEPTIDCIAAYGIAEGIGDGRFGGTGTLTGPQTAAFLVRTLEAADVALPEPGAVCEGDGGALREDVEVLLAAGVVDVTACEPDTLSRGRMAQWVADALAYAEVSLDASTDWFVDDDGSEFEVAIDGITELGVVTGKARGVYAPADPLTRAQMSVFLARMLDALA